MKNFTCFHEHLNTRCYVSKKQLLSLITLCIATIGYSQTFTALDNNNNTLEFTITSATTVEVKDYISGGTDVDIPATVSDNSTTYDVTSIGTLAFFSNGLTSAVIPSSVTNVSTGGFSNNSLTSINIPNSVTIIGNNAFQNNQLSNITIPSSVTNIGSRAFISNPLSCIVSYATTPPAIVTPTGPDTTTDSFSVNRSTIDLSIPSGTANAYSTATWTGFNSVTEGLIGTFTINHITYQINATPFNEVTVIDYNTAGGSVVDIPATVSSACTSFTVISIGNNAFLQKGLTSVEIPNSVTTIGSAAFFDNMNLTSVMLQDGLVSIGDNTFNSCGLTNVTIPSTVTNIGNFAFYSNPLTDVTSLAITPALISTGSNDSFSADRSNIHLHIPAGTMGAYVTDSGALWTGFNPVTEDALSIDGFELANDVKIITALNTIKILYANSVQLKAYSIYTISGQKIANGTESEIPTSTFTSGIYILKLDFDKGPVVKKLVLN